MLRGKFSSILMVAGLIALSAGPVLAQQPGFSIRSIRDALKAFPCPSGDSSCGNGAPASSGQSSKSKRHHKHQKQQQENVVQQNSLPDSNPNQKIEDAPAGQNVDEGTAQDFEDMNNELNARHVVNRPK